MISGQKSTVTACEARQWACSVFIYVVCGRMCTEIAWSMDTSIKIFLASYRDILVAMNRTWSLTSSCRTLTSLKSTADPRDHFDVTVWVPVSLWQWWTPTLTVRKRVLYDNFTDQLLKFVRYIRLQHLYLHALNSEMNCTAEKRNRVRFCHRIDGQGNSTFFISIV